MSFIYIFQNEVPASSKTHCLLQRTQMVDVVTEILATLSENYAKHKDGFTVWVACSVFKLLYVAYIDTTVFIKGYRAIQYV